MEAELRLAKLEDREILSNLLEKYNYEFSQYDNRDVNKLGLYGYQYLDYYWTEPNRWAYFIEADGKLAGFVMVNDYPEIEDRKTDFVISEFFIMHKYRRSGIGKQAFYKVLDLHKGSWSLKMHPKNLASVHFWNKVVNEYTQGNYEMIQRYPNTEYDDGTPADVFFFQSNADGVITDKFNEQLKQLESVAKSYDRSIECGKKGIDLYENLPEYIINDPCYPLFQKARTEGLDSDSGRKEVKDYLSPAADMKFIDLGCCLNLMFRGFGEWPSTYHGIDISGETIKLLDEFASKRNLCIGSLHCGSIHETPFDAEYFDIGACIGVLEYFEKEFVMKAIIEAHRIIKRNGKFVLDIPDNGGSMRRFMMLIEEHMGRPDKFNLMPQEFDDILQNYFEIEKIEKIDAVAMIQYFLRRK